ncbi:MAG: PQQ-dependent sugar dehydrogenase [Devosia sp.]|uniref:glucose/sorbosone family PQQ-dependent dehydrogenase n=1 Tax=unclassified Devosia TaxID=196773 RepID=UPI0019FF3527|nr:MULTISPECIES: glucose/sorbosone family PQQ-dependent dehydrogenase [unclassified Devosia]MBF0679534.1 PQQ-dependent sugar dehydrogenase [Devosia sp.]WEJ33835.1 PQQ-dependent sugar dehydrogenase [Devosia sp. SD17-2]
MASVITQRRPRRTKQIGLWAGVALGALALAHPVIAQETPIEIEKGQNDLFSSRVLTTALSNPWAMQWGPDGQIWLTERTSGEITKVDPNTGAQQVILTLADVYTGPQHEGLLGLALHPELGQDTGNDFVYIGYTVNVGDETTPQASAQIVRYTYDAATGQLGSPEVLISGLPGGNDHNAGRVVFGPDNKLYYSIGEQGANFGRNYRLPNRAQDLPTADEVEAEDWQTYSGKILRLELDGSIPEDNPEINGVKSHIYSYGHRNPQGIAFGPDGVLYETEHGPSSDDEINIIEPGGNYGWPLVAGFIDDKAYSYLNWSEAPESVQRITTPAPEGVPETLESAFEGEMVDPLATYFTVESDFPFGEQCGFVCNPTIAPSSILYYDAGEGGIPEWDNSLLLPTLKHGVLYVQKLTEDGTAADGLPVAWLGTQNRYRDVLVSEDGKEVYIATDAFGSVAQLYGNELTTSVLHNPGAILKFTYGGEEGNALGAGGGSATTGEAQNLGGPEEGENPANLGAAPGTSEAAPPATAPAETAPAPEAAAPEAAGEVDLAALIAAGQPEYVSNCSACHGVNGEGGAGAVLAGDANLADAAFVASTIIHGMGYMPPIGADLSDEVVAQIGSYIRNSWGNDFGPVTPADAAAQR